MYQEITNEIEKLDIVSSVGNIEKCGLSAGHIEVEATSEDPHEARNQIQAVLNNRFPQFKFRITMFRKG